MGRLSDSADVFLRLFPFFLLCIASSVSHLVQEQTHSCSEATEIRLLSQGTPGICTGYLPLPAEPFAQGSLTQSMIKHSMSPLSRTCCPEGMSALAE